MKRYLMLLALLFVGMQVASAQTLTEGSLVVLHGEEFVKVVADYSNALIMDLTEEEFLARFREQTEFFLFNPYMGALCYTQLTDVMQEINGLLTPDRKPKMDVERLRKQNYDPT